MNLIYYGTGNPSTWNPVQRPGDNRWSMTLMARDADTGMAKWLYQMTPHDEWDFDGVNENILVDGMQVNGAAHDVLVHFDRNGFAYTLDRGTGELLVAKKYDPTVNWATEVVMDPASDQYGRPQVVAKYSTQQNGEDTNTTGVCPAALGTKDQQPAAYSPKTGLFYVPTNHVCMDYEPYKVSYTAGQAYIGATVAMYPAPGSHGGMGNFIAWDAAKGEIVWSKPEQFSVWSGALATDGDVIFYGTLEGYIKAVDNEGNELYKFKTPSGIIGNINTYEHNGKQYVAVLSGVGGWAGIGLAGGLLSPDLAAAWHTATGQGRDVGDEAAASQHGGPGRRRRLLRACRLYDVGRSAHRLRSPGLISGNHRRADVLVRDGGMRNESPDHRERRPGSRFRRAITSPCHRRIATAKLCSWRNEGRVECLFANAISVLALLLALLAGSSPAQAEDNKEKAAAVKDEDGKYFDADGNPTFKIQDDGTVDWYTFSGYRRYHADCHVCHGPDGVGSSYAPALANSVKITDYGTFLADRRRRAKEHDRRQGKRHAGLRQQQERLLLPGRPVRLPARARRRAICRADGRPRRRTSRRAAKDDEASCMGG